MAVTPDEARLLAETHGLRRVDQAADFREYVKDCWRLRHFTWYYAISRVIDQSAVNNLGLFWNALNPLLLSGVYYLAYGVLLGTRQDSSNFVVFLISGVFTWQLFRDALIGASLSLSKSKDLSQSMLFPRVLMPIAATVQAFIAGLPGLVLLFPIALLSGLRPNWWWLTLPLNYLLVSLFGLGVGFFMSRAINRVRDIAQTFPMAIRVLMFMSGVFFNVHKRFADAPEPLRIIAEFNPAATLLNNTRAPFIPEDGSTLHQILFLIALTVLSVVLGFIVFWRSERAHG